MKILWITNTVFPDVSVEFDLPVTLAGGWMYGLSKFISANSDVSLAVATIWSGRKFERRKIKNIEYFLLPCNSQFKYNRSLEPLWEEIVKIFNPDLCHIHGTEFPHGLACMRAVPDLKYVISIQGLVSVCSRYYYANMSAGDILMNLTFRDLIRRDTIFNGKTKFVKTGELEKEYINTGKHVIGRTSWDYTHVKAINPHINYHFCNEMLRESFYNSPAWNCSKKTDHSIFLSQGTYPLKGLHQVLKAMAIIKGDFPFVSLRVAGPDITKSNNLSEKIKLSGYGAYIKSLIRDLSLTNKVTFTGLLTEQQMIGELRNAHVFICPSSIENSSNSLGEAQMVGTPCLASFVGGIPDMIRHGETGYLYRFEEVEMLGKYMSDLFSNDNLANMFSMKERSAATMRHDRSVIQEQIMSIYKSVLN